MDKRISPSLALCLLALILIGPLWEAAGLPNTADGPLHLIRGGAMARAWSAGVFWPRWFPDVYAGLGAPTFHYYSPLFYLFVAALHSAGFAVDWAAKIVITATFLASGLAVFAWLRRLVRSEAGAFVGAALYLTQPALYRELLYQGSYPQLLALLFLPIGLWALTALAEEDRPWAWLAATASVTALLLMHNLTAMLAAGTFTVYWVFLGLVRRNRAGWLRGVVAALLAGLLGAFFWFPALGDASLVQIDNLRQGFFHYQQYFLEWPELLAPSPLQDGRAANPPLPHNLGWPALIALLLAATTLVRWNTDNGTKDQGRRTETDPVLQTSVPRRQPDSALRITHSFAWAGFGLAFTLGCAWLTTAASEPVWEAVPFLDLLEFPSRLLGPAGLGVALAGSAGVAAWSPRIQWRLAAALLVLSLAFTAVFLFPRQPFLRITAPGPEDVQRYEQETGAWGLTSGNEFLPRWADAARYRSGAGPETDAVPAAPPVWRWRSPHEGRGVGLPTDTGIVLPVHYFPAWQGVDDAGRSLILSPDPDGRIHVAGPVTGSIQLHWRGTDWQRRGEWTSRIGLLLTLLAIVWSGRRRRLDAPGVKQPAQGGVPAGVLILLATFWLARQALLLSPVDWLRPYSPPDSVLGVAHPRSDVLGERVRLLGWELLTSEAPQPGDTVHVRLFWQPLARLDADLHSFLHIYTPGQKRSWAVAQNMNPGGIPTSSWLPALYYVDDLRVTAPEDLPPASFTLAVGLADDGGGRLFVPDSEDGLIYLGEIGFQPLKAGWRQPVQAQIEAPARFGEELTLQGYDLLPAPGGPILRLFWVPERAPSVDYTLFVHLYAPDGTRIAQYDGPPLAGLVPTSGWQPGRLYVERRVLPLPEDLTGGTYTFQVGLYRADTGERLPIFPEPQAASHFSGDALLVPLVAPE